MFEIENEIWRESIYPQYLVSNLGRIKNKSGKILSKRVCKSNGYNYVSLLRLRIYFGGASPNCGAGVRPYLIRRPALAHKNPTRFSRGSMSITQPKKPTNLQFVGSSHGNTKMKIDTLEIAGFCSVLQALRLPFGKECRSDVSYEDFLGDLLYDNESKNSIHPKDMKLLSTLVKRGDEHAKVLRGIIVYAEISAPIWFYRELETYRVGRERLSSESTMHIECKGLSGEELEKAKDGIPMGHIQKTVDMFSYQCLRRIYFQRRNHRLPMWHDFCKWIETLPFAKKLIICDNND